jgi:ABC-type amino acid transport system permease subunit
LAFRFVLKLTGAGLGSDFVNFIYSLSNIFTIPFQGIFSSGTAQGAETTAVFEPATIVAVLVYAVVAWGLVQLIKLISGKKQVD